MGYSNEYFKDLAYTLEGFSFEGLKGARILVTGANGLIGSAIIDCLICMNELRDYQIQIFAAARNTEHVKERFGNYRNRTYFHDLFYDTDREFLFDNPVDFTIHAAGNAHPNILGREPAETIVANIQGLYRLLEYNRKYGEGRLLFVSSGEIYGEKADGGPYKEDTYGYVDLLNPRSCYPLSKRAAENLCVSFSAEYSCETLIVRPGHIYGPTQTSADSRASAQFLRSAAEGHDIILKSDGAQLRSYCYCLDCATAILTVLLNGCGEKAYNISYSNSVLTIRDFAEKCAAFSGTKITAAHPDAFEAASYNAMRNSVLVPDLLESLGWRGKWTADRGIARSIFFLREGLYEKAGNFE